MSPPKCGRGVTRTVRNGDKLLCNTGEYPLDVWNVIKLVTCWKIAPSGLEERGG